jgi:hypothetical protein
MKNMAWQGANEVYGRHNGRGRSAGTRSGSVGGLLGIFLCAILFVRLPVWTQAAGLIFDEGAIIRGDTSVRQLALVFSGSESS